uniref:Uncharacterized protein n=1 Tax=Parascaris equorum TaxID=6256 RepID=A0A914S5N2_PAREQ
MGTARYRRVLRPKLAEAMDYALKALHALAYISVTLGSLVFFHVLIAKKSLLLPSKNRTKTITQKLYALEVNVATAPQDGLTGQNWCHSTWDYLG